MNKETLQSYNTRLSNNNEVLTNIVDIINELPEYKETILQDKEVTPTKEIQTITSDEGYDGLNEVTVNSIPDEYVMPNGTLEITENGTYDVKEYAEVTTNIQGGGDEGYITNCNNLFDSDAMINQTMITRLLPHCKPTTAYKMFYRNSYINTHFDVTTMNMSNCTNCESMFEGLSSMPSINVSNFNTSSCTTMQSMFIGYGSSYTVTLDLSSFDTSKVTNMGWMFYNARHLRELDLSSFDFSKVTTSNEMFHFCGVNLSTPTTVYVKDAQAQNFILNLTAPNNRPENWSTSNVVIKQ